MDRRYVLLGLPLAALTLVGCQKAAAPGEQPVREAVGEMMEMGQAIKSGKPVVCTMTSAEGGTVTYQLKEGKMRADGMQLGTQGRSGSMINDLSYIYTWQQGETQGMKIAIPDETDVAETEGEVPAAPEVPDFSNETEVETYEQQGFTVDCQEQAIDDSVFVPPSDVTFVEPAAMMQGALNQMQEGIQGMGEEAMTPEMQQQLQQLQEQVGGEE